MSRSQAREYKFKGAAASFATAQPSPPHVNDMESTQEELEFVVLALQQLRGDPKLMETSQIMAAWNELMEEVVDLAFGETEQQSSSDVQTGAAATKPIEGDVPPMPTPVPTGIDGPRCDTLDMKK